MVSAPASKASIKFPRMNLNGRQVDSGEYLIPKRRVCGLVFGGKTKSGPIFLDIALRKISI
jgi:hypothetical protein